MTTPTRHTGALALMTEDDRISLRAYYINWKNRPAAEREGDYVMFGEVLADDGATYWAWWTEKCNDRPDRCLSAWGYPGH